jgi:hypothetical protein
LGRQDGPTLTPLPVGFERFHRSSFLWVSRGYPWRYAPRLRTPAVEHVLVGPTARLTAKEGVPSVGDGQALRDSDRASMKMSRTSG